MSGDERRIRIFCTGLGSHDPVLIKTELAPAADVTDPALGFRAPVDSEIGERGFNWRCRWADSEGVRCRERKTLRPDHGRTVLRLAAAAHGEVDISYLP